MSDPIERLDEIRRLSGYFDKEIIVQRQKGEPMGCDLYKVTTGGVDVARYMSIDTARILVKALMAEYYDEPDLSYTIKRERKENENGTDSERSTE